MNTTHDMTTELLRWNSKRRHLSTGEARFVRGVAHTTHPSQTEHDLIAVLHTRAESANPTRQGRATFALLAEEAGIRIGITEKDRTSIRGTRPRGLD